MSSLNDTPEQLYILKKYQNGRYENLWKTVYRQLSNLPRRRSWQWATTIGYTDENGEKRKINKKSKAVKALMQEFRNMSTTTTASTGGGSRQQNRQQNNRRRRKQSNKPPKELEALLDTRKIQKRSKKKLPPRDSKGRFIKAAERERLIQLSLLRQQTSTEATQQEINNLENVIRTGQETQNNSIDARLYQNVEKAKRERDAAITVLNDYRNELSNLPSSSNGVRDPEQEKPLLKKIKEAELLVEKFKQKVIEANNALFQRNQQAVNPTMNNAETYSDGDTFNDNLDGDAFNDGERTPNPLQGETPLSVSNSGEVTPPGSPTARFSPNPNEGPLLDENVSRYLQRWNGRYTIQGVERTPIQLKTVLRWVKQFTLSRFCNGLQRAQNGLRQRPSSFFTKFMYTHTAKVFRMVHSAPLSRFSIAGDDDDIMWAAKSTFAVENPDFFGEDIPGNNGDDTLLPVLYNPDNYYFRFNRGDNVLIHPVIGQASAITRTHVILLTANVRFQMTSKKNTAYRDAQETYYVDFRKLFELMFLMRAYNKNKGKIVSIYDPHPAITAVDYLVKTTFPEGIPNGQIIYKPWFDYEKDSIKTLLGKPIQVLRHAWYSFCWKLPMNDGLPTLQRVTGDDRRWDPNLFNGVRKQIYDEGVEKMNELYNEIIRQWGEAEGEEIINARNIEPLNTPLVSFEALDDVFTPQTIRNFLINFQNRMNANDTVLKSREGLPSLNLNLLVVGKNMYTALYTQSIRNVKRGVVQGRVGGNANMYRVKWDLPAFEFDGGNVSNVERILSLDEILSRQRMVASFFLTRIVRMKPLYHDGDETTGTKLAAKLRTGDVLDSRWTKETNGETYLHRKLHEHAKRDFVTFEVDATVQVEDTDGTQITLMEKFRRILDEFMTHCNTINTDPCKGGQQSVSKKVQKFIKDTKSFFEKTNVQKQTSATKYFEVVRYGQNYEEQSI